MPNSKRLYPDWEHINSAQPTDAEKHVLKILDDKLNPSVEIFYKSNINSLICDIILLKENCGAVIIECDSFDRYSIKEKDEWHLTEDDRIVEPPYKKAQGIKEVLVKSHFKTLIGNYEKHKLIKAFAFLYSRSNSKPNRLISSDKKHDEIHGIDILNKHFNQEREQFTSRDYKEIRRLVKPSLHSVEGGVTIELTKKQQQIVDNNKPQLKVKGVSGSGKTVVLAWKAVHLQKITKQDVLILTFNITLRNYMKSQLKKVRGKFFESSIIVIHYHEFIHAQCAKLGFPKRLWNSFDDPELFSNISSIRKYQTIIIDEVQDYKPEWLRNLKDNFLRVNGNFIVFGDEKQNVYGREQKDNLPVIPGIKGKWTKLSTTLRLNSEISYIANKFQEEFFKDKEPDIIKPEHQEELNFDDKPLLEIQNRIEQYNADKLIQDILTIARDREMSPNDICIIFTGSCDSVHKKLTQKYHEEHVEMCAGSDAERREKKLDFKFDTGTIKLATAHSFKGWEAHHVFLIVIANNTSSEELIYTGITRSKKDLIIFNYDEKYESFFNKYLSSEYNFNRKLYDVAAKINNSDLATIFNNAYTDFSVYTDDRCSVNFDDFRRNNYDNSNYSLKEFQQAYILKYYYSYFLDYKILYAKFFDKFGIINELNILSAGCGSGIDFLALTDYMDEKELYETITLKYIGIDSANWNYIPSGYSEFKFIHNSLSEVAPLSLKNINIIFFPRSLSDIDSNSLKKFSKIFNTNCQQKKVYIIASFVTSDNDSFGNKQLNNDVIKYMTNFQTSKTQDGIERHEKSLKVLDYPQDVWRFTTRLYDTCDPVRKSECKKECKFIPMMKVNKYSSHQIIELIKK